MTLIAGCGWARMAWRLAWLCVWPSLDVITPWRPVRTRDDIHGWPVDTEYSRICDHAWAERDKPLVRV